MLNKWFWLELRWAALVNGSAEMVVAILSALIFVPPMIYALILAERLNSISVGFLVLSAIEFIVITVVLLLVNGLLLYGVYKNNYLFCVPWLVPNLTILLQLGKGMVNLIRKDVDLSVVLVGLFTAYCIYSYVAIGVLCWRLYTDHRNQMNLAPQQCQLNSIATTSK